MPNPASAIQNQPKEGVTVVGEAFRRVPPENADFLVEINSGGTSAAQALHDNQTKTSQFVQALAGLGVQPADVQTVSLNVYSVWSPMMQGLPGAGAVPQIGQPGFPPPFGAGSPQPDAQFGSYQARNTLRVNVRQAQRTGEIVDLATRTGANVSTAFSFQANDEAAARRTVLEAAGRDARSKAEALATAAGKQIGDPISITEDCIVSNGTYAALRSTAPFAVGPGVPQVAGDLEYYARVTATFRLG